MISTIFTVPSRTDRHIYMTVFLGVLTLIWLSSESTQMLLVTMLGFSWAVAIVGHVVIQRFQGESLRWCGYLLAGGAFGALVGGLASVMAIALMVFKNVQHAHLTPDFPNETIISIAYRLPAWAVVGGLAGLAFVLYQRARYQEQSAE